MYTLVKNIGAVVGGHSSAHALRGESLGDACIRKDSVVLIKDDLIAYVCDPGALRAKINGEKIEIGTEIDAKGGWVFPSFCDSHTHIVYSGSREGEFEDKINGLSYEDIAKRGGGILNSCRRLRETSEEDLYQQALSRAQEVIRKGTGAIEIKSGYGLSTEAELKMLRVIKRIKENTPLTVKSTFLGAHAVPEEYRGNKDGYVKLICREMLPEIAREQLADYVDVFCDRGFFTVEDTSQILECAATFGLRPKIHGDELDRSGGSAVAVKHNAVSVDHLERIEDEEISILSNSDTIPTALPGASFFLGMPYAPGRRMISAGLPLALASDFNPGSSPSGDMKFINSLACIKMKLTPAEALNATTINGAAAMELAHSHGSVCEGKKANLFITRPLPSLAYMAYAYTEPIITHIILNGQLI